MMRRADRSDWDVISDDGESRTLSAQPDWGDSPMVQPQPSQTPVYHPHAPAEVPSEAPTTPPLPEKLPIGDPKQAWGGDMASRWPSQGVYY